MSGELNVFPTFEALTREAASRVASLIGEAIGSRGRAMVALSGGSTPRGVYAALASHGFRQIVRWKGVHVFWGDERCVPPTHPDSNFRMAEDALLKHVPVQRDNIHRIMGEEDPGQAALSYEEELRRVFGADRAAIPSFDLVLLGLGEDGHTASLFPGTSALSERRRLVTEVFVPKLGSYRVTATFPLINNARHLLFLVSGKAKAGILAEVLRSGVQTFPAQLVRPAGDVQWLVDQDAASQIEQVRLS